MHNVPKQFLLLALKNEEVELRIFFEAHLALHFEAAVVVADLRLLVDDEQVLLTSVPECFPALWRARFCRFGLEVAATLDLLQTDKMPVVSFFC